MKYFFKVFFVSLIGFSLLISLGFYMYNEGLDNLTKIDENPKDFITAFKDVFGYEEYDPSLTPLERAIKKGDRLNVLLLGFENVHSDTMMVASYDKKTKCVDILSIPRDTYIERDGFVNSGNNKINTVYTAKGIEGLKDMIQSIIGVPIHHYVAVDYDAVREAVDAIDGVEVDVPFHMKYYDDKDTPPLRIDIPAGKQIIYGDKAVEYLRFRKTNYEGFRSYPQGDIQRIEVQQQFVKSAIKKSLSLKLPSVIKSVFPYVETDFNLSDLTTLGISAIGMSLDDIKIQTLPGTTGTSPNGTSFYYYDEGEAIKFGYDIYGVDIISQEARITE